MSDSPVISYPPKTLIRAASLRIVAACSGVVILGVPRHVGALEALLRLLLAVVLWEAFRGCIQGADPSKRRWLLILFLTGLLSVGSLQVLSASVNQQTATALLFAFATAGISVWLQRRGEELASWWAEYLSMWTLSFASFLMLMASWIWQPLTIAAAIAAALSAPLLLDNPMRSSPLLAARRTYASMTWLAPLVIAGLTVIHALPPPYMAMLLYLPLTRSIHVSLQIDAAEAVSLRNLYCAAVLFPVLLAAISLGMTIL